MKKLDEIALAAKTAYKKSFLYNCEELQDDILLIIRLTDQLQNAPIAIKNRSGGKRETIGDSKYRDLGVIAYVLSEYGHKVFNGKLTQAQTIEYLANILSTKSGTLRNMRDSLDSYTNSKREGWKMPLSEKLRNVLEECIAINPPEDVIDQAKNILLNYKKGSLI